MRNVRLLAVGIGSSLAVVALLSWPVSAQAPVGTSSDPADKINPPVSDCNLTPDTDTSKTPAVATPITPKLLASGQPCQQKVSTTGLVGNKVPGHEMANLQRDLKLIEDSHGNEILNLVLARGYLAKLFSNPMVAKYLDRHQPDIARELRDLIDAIGQEHTGVG